MREILNIKNVYCTIWNGRFMCRTVRLIHQIHINYKNSPLWVIVNIVLSVIYPSIHPSIHTYVHTYIHTYRHTYIHTYTHTHIHSHTNTHTQTHTHTHTHRLRRLRVRILHQTIMMYTVFQHLCQNWLKQTFLSLTHSFTQDILLCIILRPY